ncbi:hypothetical protein Drorol1_Dr00013477 [Drosera rotundifolia]
MQDGICVCFFDKVCVCVCVCVCLVVGFIAIRQILLVEEPSIPEMEIVRVERKCKMGFVFVSLIKFLCVCVCVLSRVLSQFGKYCWLRNHLYQKSQSTIEGSYCCLC